MQLNSGMIVRPGARTTRAVEEKAVAAAAVTIKNILNAREDGEREGGNWDE
jgi:hypothetical protein